MGSGVIAGKQHYKLTTGVKVHGCVMPAAQRLYHPGLSSYLDFVLY